MQSSLDDRLEICGKVKKTLRTIKWLRFATLNMEFKFKFVKISIN